MLKLHYYSCCCIESGHNPQLAVGRTVNVLYPIAPSYYYCHKCYMYLYTCSRDFTCSRESLLGKGTGDVEYAWSLSRRASRQVFELSLTLSSLGITTQASFSSYHILLWNLLTRNNLYPPILDMFIQHFLPTSRCVSHVCTSERSHVNGFNLHTGIIYTVYPGISVMDMFPILYRSQKAIFHWSSKTDNDGKVPSQSVLDKKRKTWTC